MKVNKSIILQILKIKNLSSCHQCYRCKHKWDTLDIGDLKVNKINKGIQCYVICPNCKKNAFYIYEAYISDEYFDNVKALKRRLLNEQD